ncbi:RnfABCDGE type electron transport complex subunit D [candidate division KSB1 bacterium]|nr:RnfABCDGE type electron transport complex subunit D [candidate division KSB1 bacterium]
MDKKYFVSSSPHIYTQDSIPKIMYTVILTLVPAGIGSVYFFGLRTLWIMAIAIVSAVAAEAIVQRMMKRPVTVYDGSAILTGLLLAYNVAPSVPLWLPAVGSVFAIAVGKMVFGGLGYNPMNPALLGRAFLLASWPAHMTIFSGAVPRGGTVSGIDAITNATPLNVLKAAQDVLQHPQDFSPAQKMEASEAIGQLYDSIEDLFLGRIGGCIGETSVVLLLIGAAFLMYRRYIGWKVPFTYVGTVALLTWIFGGADGLFTGNPIFHVLSGGLILGAFYMATDMVTSPVTVGGRIYFGIGCGVITVVIRLYGGYPEGVSYSILLMNLLTPLLDRWTRPKVFGGKKKA